MGRKRQMVAHTSTVEGCVSDAMSELQSLGEELRSWYDNMPENLQGGDKGNQVDEAASALEGLNEPTMVESVGSLPISWETPKNRGTSRSARRDDCTLMLDLAHTALQNWMDDDANKEHADRSEVESLISEIEDVKDEADGVEFPSAFS